MLLLLAVAPAAGAAPARDAAPPGAAEVAAPGWEALRYPAPVPGTYELPPLGEAADGRVLDATGRSRRLHDLLGEKIVVLSFIYTTCPDANACPLATYVLTGVARRVREHPALREAVRLVTLSFDPVRDRPEVMREYARHVAADGADWHFLTTDSVAALAPILRAYGQSLQQGRDRRGDPVGPISHILRVHLIDRQRRLRNTYTTSFLHADTVVADVRTLLAEAGGAAVGAPVEVTTPVRRGAGDDRRGYERADYRTRSRSLAVRHGRAADLLRFVADPPRGLPPVPVPARDPVTAEKVALGRKLFFDRRLSGNGTISCAMCHVPGQGFASNELATAVGIEGRTVRRNAPTLYNVAFAELLFHDGRETRLERQVWGPLLAANEMGNPSVEHVVRALRRLPDYTGLFEEAFDGHGPSEETVGRALASYERTLVSANSAFDRWYFGKEADALSAAAARGFTLFTGRARCAGCHPLAGDHALFTDHRFHNTGVGFRRATLGAARRAVPVAPGTILAIDPAVIAAATEPPPRDLGRYEISGRSEERWQYRTPGLRNVALTAPYMHDGSLVTLRDVVAFYDAGGVPHPLLDPLVRPLGLSAAEREDLVAFLESLTGDNVDAIAADARAAPVGDPG